MKRLDKILSKIFFNIFERVGTIRVFVVLGLFFSIICVVNISRTFKNNVYYYTLGPVEINSDLKKYYHVKDEDFEKIAYLSKVFPVAELCKKSKLENVYDFLNSPHNYVSYDGIFNDNNGKKIDLEKVSAFCDVAKDKDLKNFNVKIFSFSYLFNYLWAIFWFYFPFILVSPIKFIINGYEKDRKQKG